MEFKPFFYFDNGVEIYVKREQDFHTLKSDIEREDGPKFHCRRVNSGSCHVVSVYDLLFAGSRRPRKKITDRIVLYAGRVNIESWLDNTLDGWGNTWRNTDVKDLSWLVKRLLWMHANDIPCFSHLATRYDTMSRIIGNDLLSDFLEYRGEPLMHIPQQYYPVPQSNNGLTYFERFGKFEPYPPTRPDNWLHPDEEPVRMETADELHYQNRLNAARKHNRCE